MLLATAFLPVLHVNTGVSLLEAGTMGTLAALFQYFRQEWMTDERLPLWNVHNHNRLNRKAGKGHNELYELLQLLIAEQGVMDTLIQQVLSGNVTVGDLRRVNRVYAQKQRQVAQYTGEYTNGRRTLEQFLEALINGAYCCVNHCVRAYGRRELLSYDRELPPRHRRASPLRPRYGIAEGSLRNGTTWTTRAAARSRHIDRCRLLLRFRHRSKEERSDRPSRAEDVKWLGGPGRGGKDLFDENR
ncbi:hypothetical protein T03_253 [Trichinella britovi]|uniref:Uncharacterized protein n=1 Tax=Trichinella britovi TaxID=45882 RepID=A0A0V1CD11_TRIBR|nr:hypothetical protein T03_253 [Trichinella britovi]